MRIYCAENYEKASIIAADMIAKITGLTMAEVNAL